MRIMKTETYNAKILAFIPTVGLVFIVYLGHAFTDNNLILVGIALLLNLLATWFVMRSTMLKISISTRYLITRVMLYAGLFWSWLYIFSLLEIMGTHLKLTNVIIQKSEEFSNFVYIAVLLGTGFGAVRVYTRCCNWFKAFYNYEYDSSESM